MSTISKEIAQQIIHNNGYYPGDPQYYAVLTYTSAWNSECYAIVHNRADLSRYTPTEYVRSPKVIWHSVPEVQKKITGGATITVDAALWLTRHKLQLGDINGNNKANGG